MTHAHRNEYDIDKRKAKYVYEEKFLIQFKWLTGFCRMAHIADICERDHFSDHFDFAFGIQLAKCINIYSWIYILYIALFIELHSSSIYYVNNTAFDYDSLSLFFALHELRVPCKINAQKYASKNYLSAVFHSLSLPLLLFRLHKPRNCCCSFAFCYHIDVYFTDHSTIRLNSDNNSNNLQLAAHNTTQSHHIWCEFAASRSNVYARTQTTNTENIYMSINDNWYERVTSNIGLDVCVCV